MKYTTTGSLALAVALVLFGGCVTEHPDAKAKLNAVESAPEVMAADKLFQQNRYTDAIEACIAIARKDPLTPGLADLQGRINAKMAQLRTVAFEKRTDASDKSAIADGLNHGLLPDTYRLHRNVLGETAPLRTPPTKMQKVLKQPISVSLDNVNLTDIVAQIAASQNINIVTDGSLGTGTLTIHATNTPLSEILDYVGRNLKVSFNVGENVIWVTKREETNDSGIPFETRIYRLRKGLSGDEITPGSTSSESDIVNNSRSSGNSSGNSSYNNGNTTPYNGGYGGYGTPYYVPATPNVTNNYYPTNIITITWYPDGHSTTTTTFSAAIRRSVNRK